MSTTSEPKTDEPRIWKGVVVIVCMLVQLGCWGWLIAEAIR